MALPHLGASTPESEDNCAVMAVDQIKDYLENGNILNSVNLPSISMAREAGTKRICIITKTCPIPLLCSPLPAGKRASTLKTCRASPKGNTPTPFWMYPETFPLPPWTPCALWSPL